MFMRALLIVIKIRSASLLREGGLPFMLMFLSTSGKQGAQLRGCRFDLWSRSTVFIDNMGLTKIQYFITTRHP